MRVLVTASNETVLSRLKELTESLTAASCSVASSSGEARRKALDEEFSITVVNFPLQEESGEALCRMLLDATESEVIALVKADIATLYERLSDDGVIIVTKPLNTEIYRQALLLASSNHHRMEALRRKIHTLELKIEEAKLVGRAKCILIERLQVDEETSHRMIERTAMDRRITLKEAALLALEGEIDG